MNKSDDTMAERMTADTPASESISDEALDRVASEWEFANISCVIQSASGNVRRERPGA